ncbi:MULTISPECIES: hypothetical protein [Peribacillus]|nr:MULTISPECIES: hypothetical protein [Peribacillus]MBD8591348.1 hypothetical protein [Peribacillus simplex]MCM3169612.1 hypothetical protein [Peribacillus frigoritolerans]MEE3955753.1 hypothetical protein [Peribacillus frigoritolerans]
MRKFEILFLPLIYKIGGIFMNNTIPVEILEENDEHVIGPKNEDVGF